MNKQVLSPFDCDMCAMIEDITKQEIEVTASDTSIRLSWAQNGSEGNDKAEGQRIEALKQAIRGRLGDLIRELNGRLPHARKRILNGNLNQKEPPPRITRSNPPVRLLLKLPICLMSCSEQILRPVAGKWRKNLTSTKRR